MWLLRLTALLLAMTGAALANPFGVRGFTDYRAEPEEYLKEAGPEAKLIAHGAYKIDGVPVNCGTRPTVIDPNFSSWGGALPGFLIMNPVKTKGLPRPVKLYIYAHECGHQFIGADEMGADCFSIRRGVRWGWLDRNGLEQVCAFISTLKGDSVHPPGPRRCDHMRQCYAKYGGR
jgi:hypothetical protein